METECGFCAGDHTALHTEGCPVRAAVAAEKPANSANANRYEVAYGAKYVKGLDVVAVAKLVRKDLKALGFKAKYSVTTERYSGGQSLRVKVTPAFAVLNPAYVAETVDEPHAWHYFEKRYNEAGQALLDAVEAVHAAYNYDGSDSQSDYFHVNYYGDVTVEDEVEWKTLVAAEKARRVALLDAPEWTEQALPETVSVQEAWA